MAERDLPVTPALKPTPERWLDAVLDQFDEFLKDHASCEKKASGMAMSVAAHYPDQPRLLEAMVDLAVEELNHYREVVRLLLARNIAPGPDRKDAYIHALNHLIRRGSETFLLDRLLVGAVVERRGAERFGLIAAALDEPKLKDFYRAITASEQRHWTLFLDLAKDFYPEQSVWTRFYELSEAEAEIMLAQPALPALH